MKRTAGAVIILVFSLLVLSTGCGTTRSCKTHNHECERADICSTVCCQRGTNTKSCKHIAFQHHTSVDRHHCVAKREMQVRGIPASTNDYSHLRRLQPLDPARLQLFDLETSWYLEVQNEENNIFLYRTRSAEETEDRAKYPSRETEAGDADITWHEERKPWGTCGTEVMRFRLSPKTIEYIVTHTNLPLSLRYVALRELRRSGMSHEQHVKLFESATRDPSPSIRTIAIKWAPEPDADVVSILARSLCDPCVDVAYTACSRLSRILVGSVPETGQDLLTALVGTGRPSSWYYRKYRSIRTIAEAMHTQAPHLVTEEDLHVVRSRAMPSRDWWEHHASDPGWDMWEYREYVISQERPRVAPEQKSALHVQLGQWLAQTGATLLVTAKFSRNDEQTNSANGHSCLLFTVLDPKTFAPLSPVYSYTTDHYLVSLQVLEGDEQDLILCVPQPQVRFSAEDLLSRFVVIRFTRAEVHALPALTERGCDIVWFNELTHSFRLGSHETRAAPNGQAFSVLSVEHEFQWDPESLAFVEISLVPPVGRTHEK